MMDLISSPLISFLIAGKDPESNLIPKLGSIALGAQRLLPSLQQLYIGWSGVRAERSSISGLLIKEINKRQKK